MGIMSATLIRGFRTLHDFVVVRPPRYKLPAGTGNIAGFSTHSVTHPLQGAS